MKTVAVVGTQWGDEGKGKIVDMLAADADVVVRFQGGNNAAHTLVVGGKKFVLRLVPAGALHPGKACVIGNGLVVNPIALLGEIAELKRSGHLADDSLFKISYEAHMVMPYHLAIDRAREARAGKRAIGTTGFGIGPAYEDKMARVGLRFEDLLDFKFFEEKLRRNIVEKNAYLKALLKTKPIKADETIDAMKKARRRLLPYLCDTGAFVSEAIDSGKRVLFEGAHGTMLDIDHGTYPYVTSSSCVASAVFGGTGIGPGNLEAVLGISKGYTTRVGAGPFPERVHRLSRGFAARRRRRVRQRHRTSATDRMVRRCARALHRSRQRDVGARAHQARRFDRNRSDQNLRRLCREGQALRRHAAVASDADQRQADFRRDAGMERESSRRAHAGRITVERAPLRRANQRTGWRTNRDDRRRQRARSNDRSQQPVRRLALSPLAAQTAARLEIATPRRPSRTSLRSKPLVV